MKRIESIFCIAVSLLYITTTSKAQLAQQIDTSQQCVTSGVRSVNSFGVSLTRALEKQGNVFISPMSIYTALAMVYNGAEGETAQQMANALQLTQSQVDKAELNAAFRGLLNDIRESSNDYQLSLANALYLQQSFSVKQDYVNDVQEFYDAVLKTVNFISNGTAVKEDINVFIAEKTNNKIDNFLKEPLDPTTVMALLNAIYFKGTWKTRFPLEKTRDGIFHKNDGSTKNVKFMTLINQNFRFFEDYTTNYKFLELPYKGGDISMLLALPNSYEEIPNLEMTSEVLCRVNASLRNRKVESIAVPKFQLKYRKELVNTLQQLGIQNLFDNSADLAGIREERDLQVSTVVHEAVIDVNEEGSEAAAATGVFITRMSISLNVFEADHPFLFYIIDNRTGLILFSGRVADP